MYSLCVPLQCCRFLHQWQDWLSGLKRIVRPWCCVSFHVKEGQDEEGFSNDVAVRRTVCGTCSGSATHIGLD